MEFTAMVKMTQKTLKKHVARELEALGYAVRAEQGFVYAPGKIPVLLVAHLDTVHRLCARELQYTADKNLVRSPQGIGGDDRCGVHILLRVLQNQNCHALFCEDEETGSLGARAFAATEIRPAVNYIVALDRSGADDAVFYDCDNPAFTEYICGFGFCEKEGTRSDISVLAPHLGIAGANLSAGYYRQHQLEEYVNLAEMEEIYHKVCRMVQTKTGRFPYIQKPPPKYAWNTEQGSLLAHVLRMEEEAARQQEKERADQPHFYTKDD